MSSHEKQQLGVENLETRLNQSVMPTSVGWPSAHYATPMELVKKAGAPVMKLSSSQWALPKDANGGTEQTGKPVVTKSVGQGKTVQKPAVQKTTASSGGGQGGQWIRTTPPFVRAIAPPRAKGPVVNKPSKVSTTPATAPTKVHVVQTPTTVPTTPTAPTTTVTQTNSVVPAADSVTPVNPPSVTGPTTGPSDSTSTSTATTTAASDSTSTSSGPTASSSTSTDTNSTTSTGPVQSNKTLPVTSGPVTAPDPLAPILAKLYGDGVHDDGGTIQQLVDTAYAQGIANISLPAGTFLLDQQIHLYGTNVTVSGQGDLTTLAVNTHYTGLNAGGSGLAIYATLDSTPLMIAQPVTGNTIVFRGSAAVTAGQKLFLSNGLGSTALIEAALHGGDTGPGAFQELGPDEYVQVASVSQDANGNTVATLAQNVIGAGQYTNVGGAGVVSDSYLHAVTVDTPAENITVQNLAISFKDQQADTAVCAKFVDGLTLNHIHVLNTPTNGGLGGVGVVGTTRALIENVIAPSEIGLNSTRRATVINNTVQGIALEEASTDNLITQNTLTRATGCDFRINDMACARNTFSNNTVHGGVQNTGAIAIVEGVDTTVANNVIQEGVTSIWLGETLGTKVLNNIASSFSNYAPLNGVIVTGNSWQS
jgi:hypothetical protein